MTDIHPELPDGPPPVVHIPTPVIATGGTAAAFVIAFTGGLILADPGASTAWVVGGAAALVGAACLAVAVLKGANK